MNVCDGKRNNSNSSSLSMRLALNRRRIEIGSGRLEGLLIVRDPRHQESVGIVLMAWGAKCSQ
jgi:hypothetical protein